MAPPPSTGASRPARPAHRYRPGQAPQGYRNEDGSEGSGEEASSGQEDVASKRAQQARQQKQQQQHRQRGDGLTVVREGQKLPPSSGSVPGRAIKVQVTRDVGQAIKKEESSEEESEPEDEAPPLKPSYRAPPNKGATAGAAAVKQESSEYESSSEEESSEEDAAPAPLYKPVFVSKRNRDTVVKDPLAGLDTEEAELKRQSELEERRKQSTQLAGEAIKRELAVKDSSEIKGLKEVDDRDGLDPQSEFEAWKLRELMRVKREKEANADRDREREELEARRALPEALRLKEDTERAAQLRADKAANRGSQNFLQKYHHKGAFYADNEILSRYDYTAPTEGAIRDVSSLPAAMQVRNFGKMGRTKYTHLVDQDTSDRNAGWAGAGGLKGKQGADNLSQGCFNCGGNHMKKDCPDLLGGGGAGPSGANAGPVRRRRSRSRSPTQKDSGWESRRRSRSRSRSPRRDRDRDEAQQDSYRPAADGYRDRRRDDKERERYSERDRDDKRRRYD